MWETIFFDVSLLTIVLSPLPWQPAFKLFLIPAKTLEAYKEGYVFQSFSNKAKLNKINILYISFWLKKKKNIKYSHGIGT